MHLEDDQWDAHMMDGLIQVLMQVWAKWEKFLQILTQVVKLAFMDATHKNQILILQENQCPLQDLM